jgi:hypothetical protein
MFEFDMMALHLGIPNLMKFLLQRLVELLPKSMPKLVPKLGVGTMHSKEIQLEILPLVGQYICVCVCVCYNVQDFLKYENFVSMNIMLISIFKISTNL